jgi:nucleotide-binding universal stress UspA family protein
MSTVFQHLLLATEHSEFDSGAEALAMALARRCQLPLGGVLPIVSNPEFEAAAPALATRADQQAAERIAAVHALAQAQGVSLAMQARRGPEPYQEIVDEARERGSDLIVIRRRGKRGFLAKLLLGEMVSRVVAHAPCSVLIVPRGAAMWQQRVLVAAEPGAQGQQLVALAGAVAAECRLPISVVTVAEPGGQAQAQSFVETSVAQLRQRGLDAEGRTLSGKPYEQILQAGRDLGADLIVMGSRGDAHLGRALIGGVAQKVIGLAEHPVLVAHTDWHENKESAT